MRFRVLCVAVLLSCLSTAGCGTVANLVKPGPAEGGKTPFGGVRQDVWCLKKAATGDCDSKTHPESGSEQHRQVPLMLLCAADLPFSLLGDVVTWPYVVAYSFINQPIPTPPVALAPPDQGKHKDDNPAESPMTLPIPRKSTP